MSVPKLFFRCLFLGLVAVALTHCEESLTEVDLRDEDDDNGMITNCIVDCEDEFLIDFSLLQPNSIVSDDGVPTDAGLIDIRAYPIGEPDGDLQIRVFDTDRTLEEAEECPTFDDDDLLFPGGPFGNVLVIQDENSPLCANDRRRGGVIEFDFSNVGPTGLVDIQCLQGFDTEEFGNIAGEAVSGAVIVFDENGIQIGDLIPIPGTEDGGTSEVVVNATGVRSMIVILLGSGAISDICLQPSQDGPPPQPRLVDCPDEGVFLEFDELETNTPVSMVGDVMVSGYPTPAIAFDTDDPEMCGDFDDDDMVHIPPIEGAPTEDFTFDKILVNQHRSRTDCANADPRGGFLSFAFPTLSTISGCVFFDVEEEGGYVAYYGPGETFIGTDPIPTSEDGEFSVYDPEDVEGVAKMVVYFAGSGGIDNVCYTPSEEPVEMAEYEGCTYDYKWWKKNLGQACIDLDAEVFCDMSYRDVMMMKARGRKYNLLAQQYVTALLNVACNGAPFDVVEDAWTAAGDILDDCAGAGPEADALLLQLKAFNGGLVGPDSCD